MYDEGALASTGVATLTVFGYEMGLDWIVALVVAMVLTGAVVYRYSKRKQARARG